MDVWDPYYVLFATAILVLFFSLVHSLRLMPRAPDRTLLALMTSIVLVSAYNEEIGDYVQSAQIESAGYFMLAVFTVAFLLSFAFESIGSLVAVISILVFLGAGALGGSDLGSSWLYSSTGLEMTTNTFLIVLIPSVVVGAILWWKLRQSPWFQWIISVALLVICNTFALSIIAGKLVAGFTDPSYTIWAIDWELGVEFALGFLWYCLPSYLSFRHYSDNSLSKSTSLEGENVYTS